MKASVVYYIADRLLFIDQIQESICVKTGEEYRYRVGVVFDGKYLTMGCYFHNQRVEWQEDVIDLASELSASSGHRVELIPADKPLSAEIQSKFASIFPKWLNNYKLKRSDEEVIASGDSIRLYPYESEQTEISRYINEYYDDHDIAPYLHRVISEEIIIGNIMSAGNYTNGLTVIHSTASSQSLKYHIKGKLYHVIRAKLILHICGIIHNNPSIGAISVSKGNDVSIAGWPTRKSMCNCVDYTNSFHRDDSEYLDLYVNKIDADMSLVFEEEDEECSKFYIACVQDLLGTLQTVAIIMRKKKVNETKQRGCQDVIEKLKSWIHAPIVHRQIPTLTILHMYFTGYKVA
jgi:hypothetical protein